MTKADDAFGHALNDYYQGKEAREIIERSDGNLDETVIPPNLNHRW